MLAIEKMKLIKVDGTIDSLDEFITSCCISGDFHPEYAINYLSTTLGFESLNEENPYTKQIMKIEELASIAGVTLKDTFEEDELVLDDSDDSFIDKVQNDLNSLLTERNSLNENLKKLNEKLCSLKNFSTLDIETDDLFSSKFLKVRFGSMPSDCLKKLESYQNRYNITFFKCSEEEGLVWGLYVAPRSKIDDIDRIFATLYFERVRFPELGGTPKNLYLQLSEEYLLCEKEKNEYDKMISDYWAENSVHCEKIYASLKIASLAFDLRKYAAKDKDSDYYLYVGWVPKSSLKWFTKRAEKIENLAFEISDPSEDTHSSPPVKLKNRKLIRPFEMFVEMYGLPNYGGIDITPFVAVTYTLLFGIMFADLGQGLVLCLGGYLVYKLKGAKLAKILVPCGACSAFFGLIFGSVFGYEDLLDPVYRHIGLEGKPIEVMESINTILIFAIAIGIALVVVSMILNIVCCLHDKKKGEALFSQNGLTGIILYLVLVSAVFSFMSGKKIISAGVSTVVAVVCLSILYVKDILIGKLEGKKNYMPESKSDFFMQNIFEVIEYILTYFSNTVSFLRVGAFVLVHAGMMMVFSSITSDPKSPAGITAMIFGNIIVMALEGLLTGIQVLRLEFYEMFSRFYEGDGKPFISTGKRKNKGVFFKIKKAFVTSENSSDETIIINSK